MNLRIEMRHGLAWSLVVTIPNEELEDCLLSFPGWTELAGTPGYVRHPEGEIPPDVELPGSWDPRAGQWEQGDRGLLRYKVIPDAHLGAWVDLGEGNAVPGLNLLDGRGNPRKRVLLIGNRNLGNNLWFIAWHRDKWPQCFYLRDEAFDSREYTCLARYERGPLRIERVRFQPDGKTVAPYLASEGCPPSNGLVWCTYGQQVLRGGRIVDIEEIIDQFYDIRHVLYLPVMEGYGPGRNELRALYEGYPEAFRDNVVRALRKGHPRSRYFHNAIGLGPEGIIILQRHGTVEEIGQWLREAGATDGIILDNGGSVFFWAWWGFKDVVVLDDKRIVRRGTVIFRSPDWRPWSISTIAFVLKGPPQPEERPGDAAMAVV